MTLHPPQWSTAVSFTALGDRQLIASLWKSGGVVDHVGGHLKASQRAAGANMSVDIAVGGAIIYGTDVAAQACIHARSDAVVNVPVNAAPGAGTSRIDRIYARWLDADVLGGSSSWLIGYVAGVAAASPSAPVLPASAIPITQFTVLNTTTSITTGMLTDQRLQAARVGEGLIVAEYTTPSQPCGNGAVIDKTLGSPTIRPSVAATAGQFWQAGTPTRLLCPFTGVYDVFWNAKLSASGGYGWYAAIRKNANTDNLSHTGAASESTENQIMAIGIHMNAGEYFRLLAHNITGASRNVFSTASGFPRLVYRGAV
jgi:hypothetical protein